MSTYTLTKPLRITEQKSSEYLLSVPREELFIRINDTVADFLQFLSKMDVFDFSILEEYIAENAPLNYDDFISLFNQFLDFKIVIEIAD